MFCLVAIDIFRPLLVECVSGNEILSHLDDIVDKAGRQHVRRVFRQCGSRASMEAVLKLIEENEHEHRWHTFFNALERNDYVNVAQCLRDEAYPPKIRRIYKKIINDQHVAILKEIHPISLIPTLATREIVNSRDIEDIKTEQENNEVAATIVLLDRVWRTNISSGLLGFSETLKVHGHSNIADVIHKAIVADFEAVEKTADSLNLSDGVLEFDSLLTTKTDTDEESERHANHHESEDVKADINITDSKCSIARPRVFENTEVKEIMQTTENRGTELEEENSGHMFSDERLVEKTDFISSTSDDKPVISRTENTVPKEVALAKENNVGEHTSTDVGLDRKSINKKDFPDENENSKNESPFSLSHDQELNSSPSNKFTYKQKNVPNVGVTSAEVNILKEDIEASLNRSLMEREPFPDNDLQRNRVESEEGLTCDSDTEIPDKEAKEEKEKEIIQRKIPTFQLRSYQPELAEKALTGINTIICAHTGTGKTWVALHITKEHLAKDSPARVVFLARTNALVEQQHRLFEKFLPDHKVCHVRTATQECLTMKTTFKKCDVFFMTPQILINNINNKQISIGDISLLIFDECHHTRKREPYNSVMKKYLEIKKSGDKQVKLPQVIGLTATLGVGSSSTEEGAMDHMMEICANLDVTEISRVSKNVEEFRQHVSIPKRVTIKLQEKEKDKIKEMLIDDMKTIENYIESTEVTNDSNLIKMWQRKPPKKDSKHYLKWTIYFRNKVSCKLKGNDALVKVLHAALTNLVAYHEALEVNYLMDKEHVADHLEKKFEEDIKNIDQIHDKEKEFLQMITEICKKISTIPDDENVRNPHLKSLTDILCDIGNENLKCENENIEMKARGMIFVQTRATAFALATYLSSGVNGFGFRAAPFTGTNSSESSRGMPDTQKIETLQNFRDGIINILVATSVGSEGIDVPDCNFIITYNFTGNEADIMQMSGRARRTDSTVSHISDAIIQKREEISLHKARIMEIALDGLSNMFTDDRRKKISEKQSVSRVEDLENVTKMSTKLAKDFHLNCFKCHQYAVSSKDIKIYVGQHRIVTDPGFTKRCVYDKSEASSRYTVSVIRCVKCKLKWGTTFSIDKLEVPVLKVTAFLFNVSENQDSKRFKKWGKVDYSIQTINKSSIIDIFSENKRIG